MGSVPVPMAATLFSGRVAPRPQCPGAGLSAARGGLIVRHIQCQQAGVVWAAGCVSHCSLGDRALAGAPVTAWAPWEQSVNSMLGLSLRDRLGQSLCKACPLRCMPFTTHQRQDAFWMLLPDEAELGRPLGLRRGEWCSSDTFI